MTKRPGAPSRSYPEVPCPACKASTPLAPSNVWRPFCSERCRHLDMGAWASEGYRVASMPPSEDDVQEHP